MPSETKQFGDDFTCAKRNLLFEQIIDVANGLAPKLIIDLFLLYDDEKLILKHITRSIGAVETLIQGNLLFGITARLDL